jgi:hypothetical protein
MFWIIVDRVVNLTFLMLALIIITILLNTSTAAREGSLFSDKLELFKQETQKVMTNNLNYVDNRVNKLSETQDSYQVSTDQRVYVLELRVKELQQDKKQNQRVINNNVNTLTNY